MSKNEEEKNIFQCKSKNDYDCKDEFLDANPQLEYEEVKSDGNCFFRSLAAYYSRTGEQIHGIHDPTDFHELRTYIVRKFGELIPHDDELQAVLPAINTRPIQTILSELSRTCVWNVPVFEMMVERVSDILHINLMIYRVNTNKNKKTKKNEFTVTWRLYTPRSGPSATTISVFLAANHYGLIFPREAGRVSPQTAALASALAASVAKNKAISLSAPAYNNNAENAFVEAFLKPRRNTSKKAAVRSLSNANNDKVKAAIAQSLANPKNAYNENLNRAIAESLAWMHINEPGAQRRNTRKKSAKKKVVSVGMSFENIEQQLPYKTTTKKQIEQLLKEHGVSYSSGAKKESLYELLVSVLLE